MCDVVSRPVAATGWSVRLIGRFIFRLNGLYGLVVEFGQQLALWIALYVATATVLFFGVTHLVPSVVERILFSLKLFLFLF